jgi:hypothetical protein
VRMGVKERGEEGKRRMREQVIDPVYAAMTRRRLRQCAIRSALSGGGNDLAHMNLRVGPGRRYKVLVQAQQSI